MLKRFFKRVLFPFLFITVGGIFPTRLEATQNVTFQWDASPETDVVRYRLYYGQASRTYSQTTEVAVPATSATVPKLIEGQRYFFAVTAVNQDGLESGYSTEIAYTIPTSTTTASSFNATPTLDALNTVVLAQNAASLSIPLSGISSGSSLEAQPLVVRASSGNPALVPAPTVFYSSPLPTGVISFKPALNSWGTANITVTVDDGQTANNFVSRTFAVLVNNPPTLNPIGNVTVDQDVQTQNILISGISSGAANEAQTLQVTAVSSNPALIPTPAVFYGTPNPTGVVSFKPAAGATGTAVITVTVSDGQPGNSRATQSFTVTVNPLLANAAPGIDPIGNLVVAQNSGSRSLALSGISSGSSTELQPLTITVASGNPALIPALAVSYLSPATTGTLTFSPAANLPGAAIITVTVQDGQPQNGSTSRSFTVTVNNPPTLSPIGNVSVKQDSLGQNISLTGISSGAANESQTLQITASSSNPNVVPVPSISYASPNSTGVLSFKPAAGAVGTSVISVTVNDGQTGNNTITRSFTVSVNALAPNIAPTLDPIGNIVLAQNAGTRTVPISGISAGASTEMQPLSVTAVSSNPALIPAPVVSYASPNATGSLSFSAMPNLSGTAAITVTVNDGQSMNGNVSRTFSVTVNNSPTLNPIASIAVSQDSLSQNILLSGISTGAPSEAQPLQITASSSNPSLIPNPIISYVNPNSTGVLTFKPAAGSVGSAVVTVTVSDGQPVNSTVARSFTITVNTTAVNVPPTLAALPNVAITQNLASRSLLLSGITSGLSNEIQPLTVTATSSNPALIPSPVISYSSPNTVGSISFTPTPNAFGTSVITVNVSDGQPMNSSVSRSFILTVNNPPTLNPIPAITVPVSSPSQAISLSGIGAGAANELQPLTVTATSSNTGLIPTPTIFYSSPNSTGVVFFRPLPGVSGTATITVSVRDGQAGNGVVSRTFLVTVGTTQLKTLSAFSVASDSSPSGEVPADGAIASADETEIPSVIADDGQSSSPSAGPETSVVPMATPEPPMAEASLPVVFEGSTPENTGPIVSDLLVSFSDARSLVVTWRTDRPANSSLEYGARPGLGWSSDSSFGTVHTVALNDLQPGSTYYIRVRATDAANGLTVTDIEAVETPPINVMSWQTENADLNDAMFVDEDGESGVNYIASLEGASGTATFNIEFPEGMSYQVWCRVKSAGTEGSLGLSIDGEPEVLASIPEDGSGAWRWVRLGYSGVPLSFLANEGFHQVLLRTGMGEVRLDEVCISNDPEWRPLTYGSAPALAASRGPKGAVDLSWTDAWSNAAAYEILEQEDDGSYTLIDTVSSSSRAYRVLRPHSSRPSYIIYASNALDRSADSPVVSVAPGANGSRAPLGVTAAAEGDEDVSITWSNTSTDQTGFSLERSRDRRNFEVVQTLGPDAAAATDIPPAPGRYFYRLKALNEDAKSDPSELVEVLF